MLAPAVSASQPGAPALWPHQQEAVDALTSALADRERATAVAACGSGKTRIGAEVASRLIPPDGRLLIVAPTLELIAQTLREYRRAFGASGVGRLVAVCSDRNAAKRAQPDLSAEQAAVTTDPAHLAGLLRVPGRVTVACTYQSLAVVRAAHEQFGAGAWSLAIVDEAHRCAGVRARPWAVIHDDALIPADRRLYMTATPRLLDADDERGVGMDDEKVFGPTCYELSFAEAISRGLLADYRLVVPVITDEHIHALIAARGDGAPFLNAGSVAVHPAVLAVQVALLRAAAQYGLRRVITYHRRITDAEGFASSLHAAAQLLQPDERPVHLNARLVSGTQPPAKRRPILAQLGSDEPGLVVVSNARVLNEGIDLPAVDAVVFADPVDSPESAVQAVGRALRTGGRPQKIATVIVPVLVGAAQDPRSALDGSAFASLWRTIRALRAHDERLARRLDRLRFNLGAHSGAADELLGSLPEWMRLTGAAVPDGFAEAITARAVRAASSPWEEMFGRASDYRSRRGHLTPAPGEDSALHLWLQNQRALNARGALSEARVRRLDELGMTWSVNQQQWEQMLQAARSYRETHGNLDAPAGTMWGDPPRALATWLHQQRSLRRRGLLAAERVADLDSLGIAWEPFDEQWTSALRVARSYRQAHGHLNVALQAQWGDPPFALGRWIDKQRQSRKAGKLAAARIAELDALGMAWHPHEAKWARGVAAAQKYRAEHGHLRIPDDETLDLDGEPYPVGSWLNRQRVNQRRGTLAAERAAQLDALGIDWNPSKSAAPAARKAER